MVIRPAAGEDLDTILKSIKGVSARRVNVLVNSSGSIWQEESYDRIIRDEEHLYHVIQYIGRNCQQAGLAQATWHRWIDPSWIAGGWGFVDRS
jgi:putative transposase